MANGFGGGFGGNMGGFTLPDFAPPDLSGIGAALAKYEADEARKGATNQYEADVADFKTNEAKELGQGLGSLDLSEIIPNLPPEVIAQVIPQLPPEVIAQVIPQLPPQVIQEVIPQLPPQVVAQIEESFLPPDGRGEPIETDIDVRDPVGTGTVVEELYETDPYVEPYQEPYVDPIPPDALYTPPPPDLEPQVIDEIAQTEVVDQSTPVFDFEFDLPGEPPEGDIDVRDPVGTGTVVEDLYETDPYVNPYIAPEVEPVVEVNPYVNPEVDDPYVNPYVNPEVDDPYGDEPEEPYIELDREPPEPDVIIRDPVGTTSPTDPPIYDDPFEPGDPDINKNWWELFGYDTEQAAIDSGDYTYDEELEMWLPNEPIVIDDPVIDDPVIDDPVIDDPIIDDPVIDDPVIDDPTLPPEEYVPEEPMYTPPVTITNPSQENLINQQRQTYNSNLSNLVYRAPDIEIDEYVRPMSAAQFGSAPGSAEDVRTPVYKPETEDYGNGGGSEVDTDMGFIAMNQGGSLNLNNSSMNRGIGQLPPMQQQDKLTQLFQSSFRPRR